MTTERADVVVIGAGIAGCATAYYLAKRGVNVVVLEKGSIGDEQSSRAWGFVRQQARSPRELPLMMTCSKIWGNLSQELNTDLEWVQGGALAVAGDEQTMERIRQWADVSKDFGLDTKILSGREIKELIPVMEGPWLGGMYTASDGHAEPGKVTNAFARAAQENGAVFRTNCAAEGIDVTNNKITGVLTEKGTITTPVVVCAAGAWSHKVARMVGLSLPYRVVRASVVETQPTEHLTRIALVGPGVAFRQRPTGSFYVAPGPGGTDYDVNLDTFRDIRFFLPNFRRNRKLFRIHVGTELIKDVLRSMPGSSARRHPFAHTVGVEPKPNRKFLDRAIGNFRGLFPSLASLGVQRYWAGRIDATPDAIPVLGEVDRPKGFIFATGFSGRGFGMGPITGLLVSELIVDGRPSLDIHNMRHSRFREGDLDKAKAVI
ncbi:MAG: NAD(P)/FAD-dependent oxidoreductase [Dehalococcoidia bacterium]